MKSILAVDDNLTNLKQIRAQLSDKYEVFPAKSGELALKICSEKKPDLILLDVEMPEMDGFQTISRLKANPDLSTIPVIFLTGNKDTATEVRCLESGAVDFITKPANTNILHHRIDLHLEFYAYQFQLEHTVKELQDNIGLFFAEVVECKDSTVAEHVMRTGILSQMLAGELLAAGDFPGELSENDVAMIKRAAPLHDVGKIGVSDLFLRKTSALTEDEYLEVQKHTIIGAEMLQQIYERTPSEEYLKMAMIIAGGHHERFDGTGYPKGLKGDDIPLCCRIVSLVNVYNICVTDRAYRKKMSHEDACRAIFDQHSNRLDPRVVAAFSRLKDEFNEICQTKPDTPYDSQWSVYHAANFGN
ncbi:MAG: response regulator [Spirochaetes bacterium]|nr:response regulator [Spirochaetota bacterium]